MIAMLVSALLAAAPAIAPAAITAPAATIAPGFRPDLFFAGRTRGRGTVTTVTSSRPRVLEVESEGRIEAGGAMVLDQAIRIDGKPSRRSFRIRQAADGTWQGTMTDAAGPVEASVVGDTLRLSYRMKRAGMRMNQTLTLQPGGRTVLNRARVTMLGVPVARIAETIEKLD